LWSEFFNKALKLAEASAVNLATKQSQRLQSMGSIDPLKFER
jgi:hypothetical protein